MRVTNLFGEFFSSEKSGGLILVAVTIVSMSLANSSIGSQYIDFWHFPVFGESITHWINDGLMTIFFLLIGLELEREIYIGELSTIKKAALPILGATGGMLVPAAIFLAFNYGSPTQSGAGIPMATDIAFAIGILSLLGSRVPASLKIFLTALAVIDDLGAILVIAIFYTHDLSLGNFAISMAIFAVLLLFNRIRIRNLFPYIIGGIAMWYFMLHSGIHSTITGVLLAFAIPFGNGNKKSTSYILQHALHYPVAFVILPLFALANTAIPIGSDWQQGLLHMSSLGIIIGLVAGKPIGIWLFSFVGTRMKFAELPRGIQWKHLAGAGFLGGIGFTMSVFITLLAFDDTEVIDLSKISILIASMIAGIIGYTTLHLTLKSRKRRRKSKV